MGIKMIRPDLWRLDVSAWIKGREYRHREDFIGGKRAANERVFEIRKELRSRGESKTCSLTALSFAEALDFYLKRNDVGSNKHYFERLKADLGTVLLSDLGERFDRWILLMRQSKSKQTGRLLTPATINRFIAWSKAALNYCVTFRVIKENPLAHFKKTKEIPRDIVLNDIDKQNLFNILQKEVPFLVPLIRFALLVPCRTGELVQMRQDDLDLFNNAIRVRCGVMKNKEMAAWKPIPPSMRNYFESLPATCEYLFPRKIKGEYLPIKTFPYSTLRRCLEKAKLKGWRLHDARHAAVSGMLNGNTPEAVVCQIAGWTSTAMLRTYYHRDGLQSLKMVRYTNEELIAKRPDTTPDIYKTQHNASLCN